MHGKSVERILISGSSGPLLLLAHGAGAPMDSVFMNSIANLLRPLNIRVWRFEFQYMAARRTSGKKSPPPKAEKLIDEFKAILNEAGAGPVFIGGKSLGGRVASMFAQEAYMQESINGLVCLGYPFHPPGKPDSLRTAHLAAFTCPVLIVQGERDLFGGRAEVESYELPDAFEFNWAHFGNHDLVPPKRSGRSSQENWQEAATAIARFMHRNS